MKETPCMAAVTAASGAIQRVWRVRARELFWQRTRSPSWIMYTRIIFFSFRSFVLSIFFCSLSFDSKCYATLSCIWMCLLCVQQQQPMASSSDSGARGVRNVHAFSRSHANCQCFRIQCLDISIQRWHSISIGTILRLASGGKMFGRVTTAASCTHTHTTNGQWYVMRQEDLPLWMGMKHYWMARNGIACHV